MVKKLLPLVLLATVLAGCPKSDPGKTDNAGASAAPVAAASTGVSTSTSTSTTTTTTTAAKDDHDLSIKNLTGSELKAIYYRRSDDAKDTWNVMSGEGSAADVVWAKGEDSPIKLDSKYDHDCNMDLKVVTKSGDEWTCGPVLLCNAAGEAAKKKIELTMTGGKLTWDAAKE
jgi:ABC-type glycerol-3-phosphate transport system substrate-binding protein